MSKRFPIIWLTGNSGAGKTTLAYCARDHFNENPSLNSPLARRIVVIDGDEMRSTISIDEGFSPEDRRRHNHRVARLANLMAEHGFMVIVAVIAPFTKVREEIDSICSPKWVYVKHEGLESEDKPYESPDNPDFIVDNDELSVEEASLAFVSYLKGLEITAAKPKGMPIKKEGHIIKV